MICPGLSTPSSTFAALFKAAYRMGSTAIHVIGWVMGWRAHGANWRAERDAIGKRRSRGDMFAPPIGHPLIESSTQIFGGPQ